MADPTVAYVKKPRIPVEKCCRICKELKQAGDFHAHKYITNQGKLSVRLDSDCKACVAAYRKQPDQRAKATSKQRKRREEHPEKMQAYLAKRRTEEKPLVAEQQCTGCKKVKPAAQFYRRPASKDGLNPQCRACVIAASNEYYRTIEPHRVSAWRHAAHIKSRYGMTLDEYEWLASAQDNKCLICEDSGVLLTVDHCHKSERIRGLLCRKCNLAVANVREDQCIAARLIRYIEQRCK